MRYLIFLLAACGLVSCSEDSSSIEQDNLNIGTFNIQWLGDGIEDIVHRENSDYERIAEVIEDCGADIMALQEIENQAALTKVLGFIPEYSGFVLGGEAGQNVGLIYKPGIEVSNIESLPQLIVKPGKTRAGLDLNVKFGEFDFRMLVVHLKSTSRYDSTDEMRENSIIWRRQQVDFINYWVDSLVSNSEEKDYIILGDFNDYPGKLNNSTMDSLINNSGLEILSSGLKSCKDKNWNSIDHIIVTESAAGRYKPKSVRMWNFRSAYPDEEADKISDHCPVIAGFDATAKDND